MLKPKVGDKFLCTCDERASYGFYRGEVYTVKGVDEHDCVGFDKRRYGWAYKSFPKDFKLVEWTTEHGHFTNYPSGNTPSSHVKPHLELTPRDAHDNLRVQHILAAMQRYVAANKAIPNEWMEELIEKTVIHYEQ